jgi:hypothetical protein
LARRILSEGPDAHDAPLGSAKKVGMATDCSTGRAGAWTTVVEPATVSNDVVFQPFLSRRAARVDKKSGPNQMCSDLALIHC